MFRALNRLRRMRFYLLFFLLIPSFAVEQPDIIEKIDESELSRENPYISIYFRPFDEKGELIKNLKPDEIKVLINNVACKGFSLGRDFSSDEWLLITTLVDVSGSMRGKPLSDEKKALKTFSRNLGIYDKITLTIFNEAPLQLVFADRDKETVILKIDTIIAQGNTSLYDAIAVSLEQAAGIPAPRKSIVVLSDGKDTASKMKYEDLLNKVEAVKISIYTIGLGKSNEKILKEISEISGGKYFYSPSSDDLIDIYFKIGENLKNTYVIGRLKLYDMDDNTLKQIEILNLRTGGRIFYNYIPRYNMAHESKAGLSSGKTLTTDGYSRLPKTLKQVIFGKNKYFTMGLILFILVFIGITWFFPRQNFLFFKILISVLLILVYFIIQCILWII